MVNSPEWVLACAGQAIDEETFAAMTLSEQDWWLGTVRHLWDRNFGDEL